MGKAQRLEVERINGGLDCPNEIGLADVIFDPWRQRDFLSMAVPCL
ncbi:hypothetical protein [Candidatus Thiosymbion oneisti]|nr:hypothetical protein [Candidatus Thiosymbion oneisti]